MSEFLAMGGYAAFVWSAYGVAAVVLLAMLAASLHGLRRQQAALRLLETARGRNRRDPAPKSAVPEGGR